MKNFSKVYLISGILVILGSFMKMIHIPFGGIITTTVLIVVTILQARHITKLEKQLNNTEESTE